jgi:hypothetical protein
MKSKTRKYILENIHKKSTKEIARDLGVQESKIREFLKGQRIDLPAHDRPPKSGKVIWQHPYFIILILFSLILLFFNDVIFRGKTLKSSATFPQALNSGPYDLQQVQLKYIPYIDNTPAVLEEPYLEFKNRSFSDGIFPLWNPHQACGLPFFANGQPVVLFPLTFLQYLISERYSWDVFIILEIFLAGLFTFLFVRVLNYPFLSATFSAIAYMFSGPIITWMVNVGTNTSVFLPFVLLCTEKIIKYRNIKWVIIEALIIGLLILSGHPEHVFFACLTSLIYFILRLIFLRETSLNKFRVLKLTSFASLLGILLSAIFLIPFIEYVFYGWTAHHEKIGLISEEKISQAITILIPYFFQNVLLTNDYQRAGWLGGYIGMMVTLLALLGIFKKDDQKNNIIFGVIAGFIIMKCYGIWIVNWIGYLPIFDKMRYSLHYTQDFAFAMAIVSGIGLQRLIELKRSLTDILISSFVLTLIIISYLLYHGENPNVFQASMYAFGILVLLVMIGYFIRFNKKVSFLLVILLVLELFYLMPKEYAPKYDAFSRVPYIDFLKKQKPLMRSYGILWAFSPNTATGYGIDDLGIYEGLFIKRYVDYAKTFIDPGSFKDFPTLRTSLPTYHSPFLDLLNVGYIIGPHEVEKDLNLSHAELIYSREVKIFKRPTVFPRAFVAHNIIFAVDQKGAMRSMRENAHDLRNTVIIEDAIDPSEKAYFKPSKLADTSDVKIVEYKSNRVKIKAKLQHPGVLVLSDTYYPGWKVSVDGRKQKIYIADLCLRGVPLDKGDHIVEFHYKPFSFLLGMWISLSTCIVIGIFGFFVFVKRKN